MTVRHPPTVGAATRSRQCSSAPADVAQSIVDLRLREMREAQVDQLTALDRQKTDFMATISHELRTPLTSINGYLELLQDGDYGDLSRAERRPRHRGRNAHRLRGLIEDLLVLNKIEATGLQSVDRGRRGRRGCWPGSPSLLRPVADAAGVSLVVDAVDPELTIRVDPRPARAQPDQPGERREVHPGGRPGDDRRRAARSTTRCVITVTDTGIGIPEKDLPELFDRFFRASNATAAAIPGTGPGPGDRAGHRRGPRRRAPGRLGRGPGDRDDRAAPGREWPGRARRDVLGDVRRSLAHLTG